MAVSDNGGNTRYWRRGRHMQPEYDGQACNCESDKAE